MIQLLCGDGQEYDVSPLLLIPWMSYEPITKDTHRKQEENLTLSY